MLKLNSNKTDLCGKLFQSNVFFRFSETKIVCKFLDPSRFFLNSCLYNIAIAYQVYQVREWVRSKVRVRVTSQKVSTETVRVRV